MCCFSRYSTRCVCWGAEELGAGDQQHITILEWKTLTFAWSTLSFSKVSKIFVNMAWLEVIYWLLFLWLSLFLFMNSKEDYPNDFEERNKTRAENELLNFLTKKYLFFLNNIWFEFNATYFQETEKKFKTIFDN